MVGCPGWDRFVLALFSGEWTATFGVCPACAGRDDIELRFVGPENDDFEYRCVACGRGPYREADVLPGDPP